MSKLKILSVLAIAICLASISWFVLPISNASDKSKKILVETTDAPKAIGPYSQAIIANGFVYVSGQIGRSLETGTLVDGGIEAETKQVLKNLEAVLKAANSDFDNVVKTNIFLADINDFDKVNEIYGSYLKAPYPARSTVQVAKIPRNAKIEIEMIALVRD